MSFRADNFELFKEILKIIKRCDGEYGDLLEDEGAELIMKKVETVLYPRVRTDLLMPKVNKEMV